MESGGFNCFIRNLDGSVTASHIPSEPTAGQCTKKTPGPPSTTHDPRRPTEILEDGMKSSSGQTVGDQQTNLAGPIESLGDGAKSSSGQTVEDQQRIQSKASTPDNSRVVEWVQKPPPRDQEVEEELPGVEKVSQWLRERFKASSVRGSFFEPSLPPNLNQISSEPPLSRPDCLPDRVSPI